MGGKAYLLCSELPTACPSLILALANEISDLGLVLDHVRQASDGLKQLKTEESVRFIDSLGGQLNRAEDLLGRLDSISQRLLKQKRSGQRVRWMYYQSKAASLKGEVREVRRRINELITTHNL